MNTEKMKQVKLLSILIVVHVLASCSSDEPRYADPEAHEKTVQLNEQYGQLMVGTWHCESISDTQRYFEQLTFNADGTLTGMRKWQFRKLVKIDGEQRYTNWESEDILEGTFSGTWKLKYYSPEGMTGEKRNCLLLNAPYDDTNSHLMAYSNIATFDYADETTLRFEGFYFKDDDGMITFQRGDTAPSF